MKHQRPEHVQPVDAPQIPPELRDVAEGGDIDAFLRLLARIVERVAAEPCAVLELGTTTTAETKRKAA